MIWRVNEGERYRPGLNIGAPHNKWLGGPWQLYALYLPGLVTVRCWRATERPRYHFDAFWRWSA